MVKCELCEKQKELQQTNDWEMQHLHFEDDEIKFLTCEKCKLESPMKYLDKLHSLIKQQTHEEYLKHSKG